MALASRVLLLRAPSGVPIDIALASFEFELEAIRRATPWEIVRDVTIRTCSAEDLIIYKLVAARGQDLVDVDGIVMRQRHALDAGWIRRWAPVFEELKEDPDLLRPFERVWARIQLP
jgi:hypothetical protein